LVITNPLILIQKEYVKMIPVPYRIVFMGSPDFAARIIESLVSRFPVAGVFTQPDRESGRGKKLTSPPVKVTSDSFQIPVFQPIRLKNPEAFELLQALQPDVIVVAAYGQILRQNVLDLPRFGCINIHASYLPRWRGAAPIQAAILAGDEYTGVSIMKMDAGIDTGPVLAMEKVFIDPQETAKTLEVKLAKTGSELLLKTLPLYLDGRIIPVAQPETGNTYAGMLKKQDGLLDFNKPALALERQVRAFDDWPGTFTMVGDQVLKIRKVRIDENKSLAAGVRGINEGIPIIGTADGTLLLEEVQPAGKKWMNGKDFLRGNLKDWLSG
jgi:methionyl-tRNA formyltransferase